MSSALLDALWLSLPLVIGGGLHMMVVRWNLFPALSRPLHVPTFGAHKTWRGFAVMIAATVPGVWISAALDAPLFPESPAEQAALGAALGFAYAVAELPNSWVKRRIGIASGKRGRGTVGVFFALVDQADSALGCALVYALWLDISPLTFAVAAGLGPVVHLLGNVSLWALGFRKEPL